MNENAIRTAREEGALISSYNDASQLESVVRWKIAEAQRLRGQQMDENTMQTVCKKTTEVLLRDYPNFTDKELDLIFEAGISGKFGKEVWVSGASILQWLNHYQNNPVRIRIVEAQNESKRTVPKLSKEEISRRNQLAFSEGYEKGKECYRKNGTIFHKDGFAVSQWPSLIYQEFKNRGVIAQPTQEQIDSANEKAKEHETLHPSLFKTKESEENKKLLFEDTVKAYLLEEHYKLECGEQHTSVKVDLDELYKNI